MPKERSIAASRRLPPIALLIGISALGPIVLNGVLPANSAIMAEFATRYGLVQLVLTVFLAANFVSQFLLGFAADRFGRRPVMIASLTTFGVGGLLCAVSTSIEMLLVARFVQGIGGAACMLLPRAIVRDVYSADRSASVIGYMTTAMMIAPLFGPALGGWVSDQYSWRFMYGGLGVAGFVAVAFTFRYQHETLRRDETDTSSASMLVAAGILLRNRDFLAYALMMMGSVGIYYSVLGGAPYVIVEVRGFSAATYGAWFAIVAVGYLLGNLAAGRFSERLGVKRMIWWGTVPGALGVVLFWALSSWQHPLGILLPMQLVAFYNGMTLPNMSSGAMSVVPRLAASAAGLAGSMQLGVGIALTAALGALLPASTIWLQVMVTIAALLCGVGLWLSVDRR